MDSIVLNRTVAGRGLTGGGEGGRWRDRIKIRIRTTAMMDEEYEDGTETRKKKKDQNRGQTDKKRIYKTGHSAVRTGDERKLMNQI